MGLDPPQGMADAVDQPGLGERRGDPLGREPGEERVGVGGRPLSDRDRDAGPVEQALVPPDAPGVALRPGEEVGLLGVAHEDLGMLPEDAAEARRGGLRRTDDEEVWHHRSRSDGHALVMEDSINPMR